MTPKEWLVDIADAAMDLGMGITTIEPNRVVLYSGSDTTITIETHFLSGRMLRSILKPRPDPAQVETVTLAAVDARALT